MPGLVRGIATVAVASATATATRNAVNRRQADKNAKAYSHAINEANAQAAPPPQQYAPPPQQYAPPPPPPPQDDTITQLERLADLKDQGILTEEEFAAQKAKILGI